MARLDFFLSSFLRLLGPEEMSVPATRFSWEGLSQSTRHSMTRSGCFPSDPDPGKEDSRGVGSSRKLISGDQV